METGPTAARRAKSAFQRPPRATEAVERPALHYRSSSGANRLTIGDCPGRMRELVGDERDARAGGLGNVGRLPAARSESKDPSRRPQPCKSSAELGNLGTQGNEQGANDQNGQQGYSDLRKDRQ